MSINLKGQSKIEDIIYLLMRDNYLTNVQKKKTHTKSCQISIMAQ